MSMSARVAVSASAGKPTMSPTSRWVNWVEPAPMNAILVTTFTVAEVAVDFGASPFVS